MQTKDLSLTSSLRFWELVLILCQVHKDQLTIEGKEERPLLSRAAHCRGTQCVFRGPEALAMAGSVSEIQYFGPQPRPPQ